MNHVEDALMITRKVNGRLRGRPAVTRPILTTLALGVAALLGLGAGAAASSWMTPAVPGSDVVVSGCVIRFSNADGTPSIHANAAHMCAGVESVRIDPATGWVEITQKVTGATQNPILFAQVQTDETLSGRGIIAGATGGTDRTRFVLHDTTLGRTLDLRVQADRDRVQGRNSNLWVGWFHVPGGWAR